jgi:hypothetical protein
MEMNPKSWQRFVISGVLALAALSFTTTAGARPDDIKLDDVKATDEGKAADFKAKAFDLQEKGAAGVVLEFAAGKKASITVRSDKKSDVHLYVYDATKKVVAKDDSPGPSCDLTFAPTKAGKYTLVVYNKGPGANRSNLKVSFEKGKDK